MSDRAADIVRQIYGFDWASVGSRREGLGELEAIIAPEFESTFSPELGKRVTQGVLQLAVFGDALEQDFAEFRYCALDLEQAGDRVVVSGRIKCVARASGMPLEGEFSHVWTISEGRAVRVEAFRDRDEARRAAGSA